jgi:hypothetical protein
MHVLVILAVGTAASMIGGTAMNTSLAMAMAVFPIGGIGTAAAVI